MEGPQIYWKKGKTSDQEDYLSYDYVSMKYSEKTKVDLDLPGVGGENRNRPQMVTKQTAKRSQMEVLGQQECAGTGLP